MSLWDSKTYCIKKRELAIKKKKSKILKKLLGIRDNLSYWEYIEGDR